MVLMKVMIVNHQKNFCCAQSVEWQVSEEIMYNHVTSNGRTVWHPLHFAFDVWFSSKSKINFCWLNLILSRINVYLILIILNLLFRTTNNIIPTDF